MLKYINDDSLDIMHVFANDKGFAISAGYRLMTAEEIDKHENPEKYLSDEEKLLICRQNMPPLSPIEFDVKLVDAKLYDQVQELIQSDIKLRIAYTRATFFSRTAPFVDQACIALNLTNEQVDAMWEQALTL